MNERITDISTKIHNERIKTKYIPSYIFENEGKIFKKLNKLAAFLRSGNCRSLTSFRKNYDVQILTVLCINYWSMTVCRERKASVNKNALVCIY